MDFQAREAIEGKFFDDDHEDDAHASDTIEMLRGNCVQYFSQFLQ